MEPTLEIQWTDKCFSTLLLPLKMKDLAKQAVAKRNPNHFTARTARASDLIAGYGKNLASTFTT